MADDLTPNTATTTPRPGLVVALFVACVAYVALRELGTTAYDDSYFFKRFAMHALQGDGFSWNVEDGPVYGSTSQAFQWVCTAVAWATHSHFVAVMRVLNALCLVGAGLWLMRRCAAAAGPERGPVVVALALMSPLALTTVVTGMETALSLLALSAVMVWMTRGDAAAEPRPAVAAAATVAVYLCRPDAAAVPAVFFLAAHATRRGAQVRYVAILAGLMAAVLGSAWLYYGTPLPLSFYMKSLALHAYDPETAAIGWTQKRLYVGAFMLFTAPLWALALRGWSWRRLDPRGALLLAAVAFCGYHLLATHEIMGYRARFYVPAVVPLALAAAYGAKEQGPRRWGPAAAFVALWGGLVAAAYVAAWIPTAKGFFTAAISWPPYLAVWVAGASVLVLRRVPGPAVAAVLLAGAVAWKPPQAPALRDDRELMARHAREVTTFRGVFDVARCLPETGTVYHSEMGVTGLVLYRMRVVDLVGILSRRSGIDAVPFEQMCTEDNPEAIFLPHRGYRALNAEIQNSACIQGYVRMVDQSSSPLHVRQDLARGFESCALDSKRWRSRGR